MATEAKLIHFLQQELALSAEEIKLAVRPRRSAISHKLI